METCCAKRIADLCQVSQYDLILREMFFIVRSLEKALLTGAAEELILNKETTDKLAKVDAETSETTDMKITY